jgi:hypothetical protein
MRVRVKPSGLQWVVQFKWLFWWVTVRDFDFKPLLLSHEDAQLLAKLTEGEYER